MGGAAFRPWQRLSGSTLKWAAIVTMFLDHLGASLVYSLWWSSAGTGWGIVYLLLRQVGRLAFPIFCFLLVEGFWHTRSRGRYALRLGAFCLIAEIPFDIAFNNPANGWLELYSQNVFFTLLLGFLALWLWSALAGRLPRWMEYPSAVIALIPCCFGAERLSTDYGGFGVLLILALGVGRGLPWRIIREEDGPTAVWMAPDQKRRLLQALLGSLAVLWYCWSHQNWIECWAVLGLLLTLFYNGERGSGLKWFFYIFYPAHLLLLGLLNRLLF